MENAINFKSQRKDD